MRRRLIRIATCLAVILCFAGGRAPARATTIDPLIWEQLVLDAGFVGVVECETAGGIVAGYRVVESWKGAPVGTRFKMRMAINYWGPQFPVTMVGERYLVTAFSSHAPTRIMSTTFGSPVPLWWRDIPTEYNLPLWQGRVSLPLRAGEKPLGELGSEHADVASFRKAVDELLSLNTEGREVRLLKALARKYLGRNVDHVGEGGEKLSAEEKHVSERVRAAAKKIQASNSAREITLELLELARTATREQGLHYTAAAILSQGGGAVTLGLLQGPKPQGAAWSDEQYRDIADDIRRRLGPPAAAEGRAQATEQEAAPTAKQLEEARAAFARGEKDKEFGEAFELLTRHDPAPVVAHLKAWRNPGGDWRSTDFGYIIGSYFAYRCGKEREANLLALLDAQDPFIRVAGAVYLAFENPALGASKLEELSRLPGDPGGWAALNLARRGHKSAVPRALELLSVAGTRGHMSGVPHENLQLRLLVLLSNSAAASGLPQPSPPAPPGYETADDVHKKYQEEYYRYFVRWWGENREKIELRDPWLEILARQKVD
ncbi:MAG TPA: hypothetical protein VFZ44_13085 [Pyrinomonadaceae bacterium]